MIWLTVVGCGLQDPNGVAVGSLLIVWGSRSASQQVCKGKLTAEPLGIGVGWSGYCPRGHHDALFEVPSSLLFRTTLSGPSH